MSLAEIDAELALVQTRIGELLANANPDVSINGKSVQKAGYLRELRTHREELLVLRNNLFPTESYTIGVAG